MFIVLIMACIVAAGSLIQTLLPYLPITRNQLQYAISTTVDLPVEMIQEALDTYFMALKCGNKSEDDGLWLYQRGLVKMHQVNKVVPFHLIPVGIAVGVIPSSQCVRVVIAYRASPSSAFSETAAAYFLESAKAEADGVVELLQMISDDVARKDSQARLSVPSGGNSQNCDYSVLGLAPGASWSQIQTAYRASCKKYHPDHVTGQQVAPHLADHASQRFKECTAAYQRLKQQMA